MKKIKALYGQYREVISYLFFGGLATLLNFILAFVFIKSMGMSTAVGNLLDNVVCIIFAYVTNHIWVFHSNNKGLAALKEYGYFVVCRLATMLMDEAIMIIGIDHLGRSIPAAYSDIWFIGVKFVAQVLVVVLNYIFSKLIIFKKKKAA